MQEMVLIKIAYIIFPPTAVIWLALKYETPSKNA
jgi:hypothetical protein